MSSMTQPSPCDSSSHTSTSSNYYGSAAAMNKLHRTSSFGVVDYIAARQDFGLQRSHHLSNPIRPNCPRRLRPQQLASAVAWNRNRMQNMILAVGPGTPAAHCWKSSSDNDDENSNSHGDESNDEGLTEDELQEEEDGDHGINRSSGDNGESEEANDDTMSIDDEEDDDGPRVRRQRVTSERREALQFLRRRLEDQESEDDEDDDYDHLVWGTRNDNNRIRSSRNRSNSNDGKPSWLPSIRHGGCINTAAWLDCPWRLSNPEAACSISSNDLPATAVQSFECPTQLVTSGDDRLVKFWDVSASMGIASPLGGGWDTFCPFADTKIPPPTEATSYNVLHSKWRQHYACDISDRAPKVAGSVNRLATLATGHRGNVFNVTPIANRPGQILTSGADGYLRLVDCQEETSRVVVHPFAHLHGQLSEGAAGLPFLFQSSAIAFHHEMLCSQTGLLASERGLLRFDLRLSPREQTNESLLTATSTTTSSSFQRSSDESDHEDNNSDSSDSSMVAGGSRGGRPAPCKACAVWRPNAGKSAAGTGGEAESTYVFAGGTSEYVGLYDLRMTGGNDNHCNGRIVQRYKPSRLSGSGNVSISGLDISRDGKELLVSYESDQIYSFPIHPQGKSRASPSLKELEQTAALQEQRPRSHITELACYGGHLNRFTFLKQAKYAGPNDEYICTGSDSGNAWFFERSSGTVVSLLGGDSSTCNGVVPHPTLPCFLTYGIDSTAKLWRATMPVDLSINDSSQGRAAVNEKQPYEMSSVTKAWEGVQARLYRLEDDRIFDDDSDMEESRTILAMPDYVARPEEIASSGRFSSPCRRGMMSGYNCVSPRIGNSLRTLPSILRQNRYECYRSSKENIEVPIDHPLSEFSHRVRLCRLKHQADRLGLGWNPTTPYHFMLRRSFKNDAKSNLNTNQIHPTDLIPDSPSDWILFDPIMMGARSDAIVKDFTTIIDPKRNFNVEQYADALMETFPNELSFLKAAVDLESSSLPKTSCGDESENTKQNMPLLDDRDIGSQAKSIKLPPWLDSARVFNGQGDDESNTFAWPILCNVTPKLGEELLVADNCNDHENDDVLLRRKLLYYTALLLKEGGNQATKEGKLLVAAGRYDKAIQYCAVALINYNTSKTWHTVESKALRHLTEGHLYSPTQNPNLNPFKQTDRLKGKGFTYSTYKTRKLVPPTLVVWSPLLKILITTRLNMALLFLKSEFSLATRAAEQARAALKLLEPFCKHQNKVLVSVPADNDNDSKSDDEIKQACFTINYKNSGNSTNRTSSWWSEAVSLQAKAYFRLGSAELESCNYAAAMSSFEASLRSQSLVKPNSKPDSLVTRRLQQAKRKHKNKKKRDRQKFQQMILCSSEGEDAEVAGNGRSNTKKS